jgi:hypothetical protein
MRVAKNIAGENVSIVNAKEGEEYFCPYCNAPLILKRGNLKSYHYAHKAGTTCLYVYESTIENVDLDKYKEIPKKIKQISFENNTYGVKESVCDNKKNKEKDYFAFCMVPAK